MSITEEEAGEERTRSWESKRDNNQSLNSDVLLQSMNKKIDNIEKLLQRLLENNNNTLIVETSEEDEDEDIPTKRLLK